MKNYLTALAVAFAAVSPLAAIAAETPAAPAPAKMTVDDTALGALLDNPKAKAVLDTHIHDVISNPQIEMARGMTLRQLQGFAGDALTDQKLSSIQADLDKLSAK